MSTQPHSRICTDGSLVSSHHTKHHLENLHPNIAVFRHPDHLPDRQGLAAQITSSLQNLSLDALKLGQMSSDAIQGIYGIHEDMILYWAHHEKLCIVDGRVAFMGGLDMCYGRWDTHQHSIADVHENPADNVFHGQDYNNARVLDFTDVAHPDQNKLDRTQTSRMGWSDVAVSFHGPAVEDIRRMFVERWNFLYDSKYKSRNDARFGRLALYGRPNSSGPPQTQQGAQQQAPYHPGQPQTTQQQAGGAAAAQTPQPSWSQQQTYQPGQTQTGQHQVGGAAAATAAQATQPSWSQQQTSYQPGQQQQPGQQTYQPDQSQHSSTQATAQSNQPAWSQQQPQYQPYQPSQQSHPGTPQPAATSTQPSWSQQQTVYQPGQNQQTQHQHGSDTQTTAQYQAYQPGQQSHPGTPQPTAPSPQPTWSQQQPAYQSSQHSYSPAPQGVSELGPSSPQPSWNQQQSSYQQQSHSSTPQSAAQSPYTGQSFPPPPPGPPPTQSSTQSQAAPYFPPPPSHSTQDVSYSGSRGVSDYEVGDRERGPGGKPGSGSVSGFVPKRFRENFDSLRGELAGQIHQYQDRFAAGSLGRPQQRGNMSCQILRSCGKWSNGTPTEHSIQDAYAEIIKHSEHFVYIENQFFITATGDKQKPVKNQIGAAIVERILRAARAGQKYKIIVVIPTVPCFAGDLADQAALGTRAIMEFQYNSINRGGNSIMELIAKEGYNPMEYIRFYNLRNYDRIKYTAPQGAPQGAPHGAQGFGPSHRPAFDTSAAYQSYGAAPAVGPKSGSGQLDTVSSCYMLNGPDLRSLPWDGPSEAEINAFVTEELYVHSKVRPVQTNRQCPRFFISIPTLVD